MMNTVAKQFKEQYKGKNIGLCLSGGIDSTAVFLSLCNVGVDFTAVHVDNHFEHISKGSLMEDICRVLCKEYMIPLVYIPAKIISNKENYFYEIFKSYKFDVIVSGDGMDRCYNETGEIVYGKHFQPDMHPYSRARYKLLNILQAIPSRLLFYKHNEYPERHTKDNFFDSKLISNIIKKEIFIFSEHHLFEEWFTNVWKEDIKSICFPKYCTVEYVKSIMGFSYNTLVLNVFSLYKKKHHFTKSHPEFGNLKNWKLFLKSKLTNNGIFDIKFNKNKSKKYIEELKHKIAIEKNKLLKYKKIEKINR